MRYGKDGDILMIGHWRWLETDLLIQHIWWDLLCLWIETNAPGLFYAIAVHRFPRTNCNHEQLLVGRSHRGPVFLGNDIATASIILHLRHHIIYDALNVKNHLFGIQVGTALVPLNYRAVRICQRFQGSWWCRRSSSRSNSALFLQTWMSPHASGRPE